MPNRFYPMRSTSGSESFDRSGALWRLGALLLPRLLVMLYIVSSPLLAKSEEQPNKDALQDSENESPTTQKPPQPAKQPGKSTDRDQKKAPHQGAEPAKEPSESVEDEPPTAPDKARDVPNLIPRRAEKPRTAQAPQKIAPFKQRFKTTQKASKAPDQKKPS